MAEDAHPQFDATITFKPPVGTCNAAAYKLRPSPSLKNPNQRRATHVKIIQIHAKYHLAFDGNEEKETQNFASYCVNSTVMLNVYHSTPTWCFRTDKHKILLIHVFNNSFDFAPTYNRI